ncbi:MAG TPA: DUF1611 domain-containing protein [Chloroflexota bacterium]|nr:DUF1611 domain-containing protein [Chloroflexota bacterium]
MSERRLVILAEGSLEFHHGKTAISLLRYRPEEVVAVVDSTNAGKTTNEVLGIGGDIPILDSVGASLRLRPTAVVIGIAPRGGGLPGAWRPAIAQALGAGVDVISGLHYMLSDDSAFRRDAAASGARLVDVRRAPDGLHVAEMAPRRPGSRVVTFVGSDCAVGKMTAALEIHAAAEAMGLSSAFVATGQTGIMLEGSGISVDQVIGDFMAGAVEQMVVDAASRADLVFVEGQGSLLHPAYSGVTLSLLHGSQPDAMILVTQPSRAFISGYPVRIPPLPELIRLYEQAAGWVKPARVVGIAVNTRDLNADETDRVTAEARALTGLPVTDPVKQGGEELVRAVLDSLSSLSERRT